MKNTSKVLIALGAGLAIGGILGVLFAPDKGVNTRHKIAENGKKTERSVYTQSKTGQRKDGGKNGPGKWRTRRSDLTSNSVTLVSCQKSLKK